MQVRELNHEKEGLLERVVNRGGLVEQLREKLVDELWYCRRYISGRTDGDRRRSQTTALVQVTQKVVAQQGVQIEDCEAVDADVLCRVDQKLDGSLVVQDHLSLFCILTGGGLALLDELLGVEQRIGVAFESARCP